VQPFSGVGDPNWFYSTLAQSSAAIVGLAGGFMVSRVLAQRGDIAGDRSGARTRMLVLHNDAIAQAKQAKRVEKSLRRALPIAENTRQLEIASIETFTHSGNHGQQGNYATDTSLLALLRQIADEARDYREALTKLAKNPKALTDNLRTGKEAKELAADWLNEEMEGTLSGGNLHDTLGQQRDWLRNDWQSRGQIYDNLKLDVANLRTRAAIGSLWGLVGSSRRISFLRRLHPTRLPFGGGSSARRRDVRPSRRPPRRGVANTLGSCLRRVEVVDVWVRVATFEGGTAEGLDAEIAEIKKQMASGEIPPGLEGVKRFVDAVNREEGTGVALVFCDTEEELRKADEALNNMSPSSGSSGRRVSLGLYEVAIDQGMT
jgi:hypothetical protein